MFRHRLTKKFRPAIERVESRIFLSAGVAEPLPDPMVTAEVMPTIYPPPMVVSGTVRGSYAVVPGRRGMPPTVQVRGESEFLRMGVVQMAGQFPAGQGGGRVTLSNAGGVVELELTRSSGRLAAGQTSLYDFKVTRATGGYAEFLGTTGIAELSLSRVPRRGAPGFTLGINPVLPL